MNTWTSADDAALNREFHDLALPAYEAEGNHVLMTVEDWNALMKANRDLWRENQRLAATKFVNLLAVGMVCAAAGVLIGKVI